MRARSSSACQLGLMTDTGQPLWVQADNSQCIQRPELLSVAADLVENLCRDLTAATAVPINECLPLLADLCCIDAQLQSSSRPSQS